MSSIRRICALPLLVVAIVATPTASAIDRFVTFSGSDTSNPCSSIGVPCRTIPWAISQAVPGDTIRIGPGVFDGPIVVNKALTLRGEGTTVSSPPLAGYTSVRAPGAVPNSAVIVIAASDVTLTNLNVQVDLTLNNNGVLSLDDGGAVGSDRLRILGNRFESVATAGVLPGRRAMGINFGQPGSAQGMEVRDNFIVADLTGPVTYFRAGIEAGQAELAVTGNEIRAELHDVLSKSCTGNQLLQDNDFFGGGVEIGDYSAGTNAVQVLDNRFSPATPLGNYAGLRLQNNQPVVLGDYPLTRVQNNTFGSAAGGHRIGVFLQKYPDVEISANTFFPAAPPVPYSAAIVVSNKVIASTSAILGNQPLRDVLITGNVFSPGAGCGGPVTCDGVVLLDHDADDPPLADAVTLGGPGALRNDFSGLLGNYVVLDAFAGPDAAADPVFGSLYGGIPATTAAPWTSDVPAPDNRFNALPSSPMSVEQLIAVATKITDLRDDAVLGLVRLGAPAVLYFGVGPGFLPRDVPPFAFVPCPGVDGTGCYDITIGNLGGTAVPEYSAIDFTVTRTSGIAPGDLAIDIQQTPGGSPVSVALAPQAGVLVGRFDIPTAAPAEFVANAALTARVVRAHFARGGSYQLASRFTGVATGRSYGVPSLSPIEVADVNETLLGAATADFATPVSFTHRIDNSNAGSSPPLQLTIDVTGQDGVAPGDLVATYDGSPVTFVANGNGVRASIAIPALAPNELRDDPLAVTFASGQFDSYQLRLSLDGTLFPLRHYADTAKLVAVGTPNGNGGRRYLVRSVGDSGGTPTVADNDYTRIDNVVQLLASNDTLQMQGTFDWAQADARSSWSLGSDHAPGNDDWSIDVPPGRTGLTFTASTDLGGGADGATILGGGDDPARAESFETFLHFFDDTDLTGATSWQGLTISNLHLGGFDFAILAEADGLGLPGVDDFDDATYENLTIDVPVDATDGDQPADFFQNAGLFVGWGSGQSVRDNVVTLHGNAAATGDSSSIAFQIGDSTNTDAYDGLQVLDNSIAVADAGPSRLRGIYENVGDTGSAMDIARNTFAGASTTDNTVGIVVSSFSSTGKPVNVTDNYVSFAGLGVRVDALGAPLPGNTGVVLAGNSLVDNGTGLRVVASFGPAPAPPVLRGNRLVGNSAFGLDNTQAAPVDAVDNWWGCNGGPAAQPAGCLVAANGTSGGVAASPWLVFRGDAAPTPIMAGMPSTFTSDFHRNSAAADTSGLAFPAGVNVSFSAVPDGVFAPSVVPTATAPRGQVVGVYTSITQGVKVLSATADAQTVTDSILVLVGDTVVVTPAPAPTAFDNDYTRINNAVQLLASNVTIVLQGTFDWTEANAAASWALGSDGVSGNDDDYSILPPAGLSGVTITAASLGSGTIQGPGDLASINLEGPFALFAGTYRGWTISNLELLDFDLGIGMYWSTGPNDFDGAAITNNRIRVPVDLNTTVAPADVNQNLAIHFSHGLGQTISDNQIELVASGISNGPASLSSSYGMQSNSSTLNAYDGLVISGNDVTLTGPVAGDPARLIGIWENDSSMGGTDITVAGNRVRNLTGSAPPPDRWLGFRMTSTSGAGGNVVYAGNEVDGVSDGFVTFPGLVPTGGTIFLSGNTITNNVVGVRLDTANALGVVDARYNRIVGNGLGIDADDDTVVAPDNWWGCNGGPGAQPAGCATPANGTAGNVTAAGWLRLAVSASPSTIVVGNSTPVTASLDDDATPPLPAGIAAFPPASVAFGSNFGSVAPSSDTIASGLADTIYQSVAPGAASVTGTLDAQTAYALVRIDPTGGGGGETFTVVSCTSDPVPCTPDAFDNDYTRIDDLVQVLREGDTVTLQGQFDWSEPNALASWSRGSDHVSNTPDDYSSLVPAGITNLTFTAANDEGAALGGATISAAGDDELRGVAFESFLRFEDPLDAPSTWRGLTIENLHIAGFDFSLFLTAAQSGNGNDDFDDATIQFNTIFVPADATSGADFFQNVGVYLGYGSDQLVRANQFFLDSSGTPDSAVHALQIGDSSNGNVFDGLTVSGNSITVGGSGPARVRGIYENAGDTGSAIVIADNDYVGEGVNDVGITVTSFGGPTSVQVRSNTVTNSELAVRVSALVAPTVGQSGPIVEGNTLIGNGTAVRVLSLYGVDPPPPLLRFNRIANNGVGLDNTIPASVVAENNWWGCNGGPGNAPPGCAYAPGHDGTSGAVVAFPWLNYAIAPQSAIVPPGGFTDVQVDVHTNSALQDVSAGASQFPQAPVTFDGGAPGTFTPATDDLVAGFAVSTLANITASASFSSQLDGQTVTGSVDVEQLTLEIALPSAAARGVRTRPFTATVTNGGGLLPETGSIVLTLARNGGPLVPGDVQLQFQLPIGPPIFITIPLSDTNGDGQLEGTIPGLPLFPGQFALNLRATFFVAGTYTLDTLVVGDTSGFFYSQDHDVIVVADDDEIRVTATGGTPQTAPVDATFALPLRARVTDLANRPLSGVTVTLAMPASGASARFAPGSQATITRITDLAGDVASSAFTANDAAGSYAGTASVAGPTCVGPTCTASYSLANTAGSPATVDISVLTTATTIVATPFGTLADADLSALVLDADGNPVPGASVAFVSLGTGAGALFANGTGGISVLTDANGVATATASANTVAGSYAVRAVIATSSGQVSDDATLTNLANADPTQWIVTIASGSPQTAALNQGFAVPLAARVTDEFGNSLAGVTVAFAVTPSGIGATAALGGSTAVTDASGIAATNATANGVAGSYVVTATAAPSCTSDDCTVAFSLTNTLAAPASVAAFDGTPQSATILTPFGLPLVAEVRDGGNTPVEGISVTFIAPSSGARATFNVPGNPSAVVVVTGPDGRATSPTLTAGSTAGTFGVVATVSGPGGPLSATFSLSNLVGAATNIAVAGGSPQAAAINTTYATPLRVRVTDAGGNPVADADVGFVASPNGSTGASAALSPTMVATDAGGYAEVVAAANGFVGAFSVAASAAGVAPDAVFALENVFDDDSVDLVVDSADTTGVVVESPQPTPIAQRSNYRFSLSGTSTENVFVRFSIARVGGIVDGDVTLEYRDPTTGGNFVPFSPQPTLDPPSGELVARYGPAAGFPLFPAPGVSAEIRATFARGGSYASTARVTGVVSTQVYDVESIATAVAELDLAVAQPGVAVAGEYTGSSATLRNIGTSGLASAAPPPTDENVLALITISRGGGLTSAAQVDLQYYDALSDAWTSIPLTLVSGTLRTGFGPPAGFAVPAGYDVTTLFRTRFDPTGSYTIDTEVVGFESGVTYDSRSAALQVDTGDAASIAIVSGTPQSTTVAQPFGAPLVVEVRDAGGNLVPGAAISFAAPGAGASASFTSANPTTTDALGRAQVTATAGNVAGAYAVTATSTAGAVQFNLSNLSDPAPNQLVVTATAGTPQTAALNQSFAVPLTVRVADRFGNAVAGSNITFTPPASGATAALAPPGTVATDSQGLASKAATANGTPGSYVVSASAAPCASATCNAAFALSNTIATPATVTAFSGSPQSTQILTAFGAPLVAEVRDASNAPLQGVSVTFVAPSSGAAATFNVAGNPGAVVAITGANGRATSPALTANATAGSYAVTATASGPSGPIVASFALTNTVGPPAQLLLVSGSPQAAALNVAFAAPVRVRVVDAGGNGLSARPVTFTAGVNATSGASASLAPPGPVNTDANGFAQANATANGFVGAYNVTATTAGVASPTLFALQNVFDADSVNLAVTSADGTGVVVQTPQPTPVAKRTNLVFNLSGTSTENVFVRFAIARAGGIVDGDVTFEYRDATTAGAFVPFPTQPTLDPGSGQLIGRYGTASGFPLFPLPGVSAEIRATFARGGAYTATDTVVGAVSGQVYDTEVLATNVAQLTLTGANPGVAAAGSYTASSVTLRNIGTSGLATALPPPNNENVIGRFTISRVGGLTSSAQADVQYFDTIGGTWVSIPLTLVSGTLQGSFGGAGFPVPAGYDATTLFRTRLDPTGSYSIAYRADGAASSVVYALSTTAVQVDTGAAATIAIVSGTPQSAIVAQAFAAPLIVEVRDAGGNVVSGAAISFAAPVSGPSASFTSANPLVSDSNGRAQVAVSANNVTGSYAVTANSTAGSVTFALTNTPGTTRSIAVSGGTPQSAVVNQSFANALQARVTDQFGNAVPGVAVTFAAPGSGASAQLLPPGDVTTDGNGYASKTASANTIAGTYLATASAGGVGGSASFALTNTAGALASLVKVAGDNQSATPGTNVTTAPSVRAVDAFSNPIAGVIVAFSVGVGGGSATATTAVTDGSGLATVGSWRLGPAAGATNTLLAAATGTTTQTFTATATTATNDVSVTVSNNQAAVDSGEVVSYAIVIANAGPSLADDVTLGLTQFGLDLPGADWLCFGSGGATCTVASGSGTIAGQVFDLPPGGSISIAFSTTVIEVPGRTVSLAVSAAVAAGTDPVPANNTATDTDPINGTTPDGIFIDGFEQAGPARPGDADKSLDSVTERSLPLARVHGFVARDIASVPDANGKTRVRVQALRAGDALYVRLVAGGKAGRSPWCAASPQTALWVTPLGAQAARVELIDAGRVLAATRIENR